MPSVEKNDTAPKSCFARLPVDRSFYDAICTWIAACTNFDYIDLLTQGSKEIKYALSRGKHETV